MKRIFALFVVMFMLGVYQTKAQGELQFGFTIGASVPSESVGRFSDIDKIALNINNKDTLANLSNDIINTGYNIGIRLNLPLSESIMLFGGLSINRFPSSDIVVTDPADPNKVLMTITETNNYIPLEAGACIDVLSTSLIDLYGVGNLSFNYLYQTVDLKQKANGITVPVTLTESKIDNRIGVGLGAGIRLKLKLIELAVEGRFNRTNLLFAENGEANKDYYNFNVFVFF